MGWTGALEVVTCIARRVTALGAKWRWPDHCTADVFVAWPLCCTFAWTEGSVVVSHFRCVACAAVGSQGTQTSERSIMPLWSHRVSIVLAKVLGCAAAV